MPIDPIALKENFYFRAKAYIIFLPELFDTII